MNNSTLALVSASVISSKTTLVPPNINANKNNDNNIPEASDSKSSSSNICCKYLSESDLTSLANQLSAYDKDLTYNVYHLDTLYNNVDYILFNSYASDTELVYNYNRRHGKNQHFLNSNYKLYINDYFNQPYDEDEPLDDDDEDENDENEIVEDNEIVAGQQTEAISKQPSRGKVSAENNNSNSNAVNLLADYELKFDIEENQFEYDFNDYQYGTYEGEEDDENENDYENEDDDDHMMELNVDDDENEYEDGMLFDDDNLNDVNLLLVVKTTPSTASHRQKQQTKHEPGLGNAHKN